MELARAGVLLAPTDSIQAQAPFGYLIQSRGKPKITDGPFTEAKELIAGYTLIEVKTRKRRSNGLNACRIRTASVRARSSRARSLNRQS